MTASTKTLFTGLIAIALIAAAIIPAAPAVAGSGGGIANANSANDSADGVFTAKLRRDPAAADPFFVQRAAADRQSTNSDELSTGGAIVVIGGLALAVTAIVMTAGAGMDRRRTAPVRQGRTAPTV